MCVSAFAEITEVVTDDGYKVAQSDLLSPEENASIADYQKILSNAYGVAPAASGDCDLVSAQVTSYSLTSSDTSGLKAIMLDLIGDYDTVVTDYTYRQGSSSYESHSIDVQPDYAWICSFSLFALIIYCLFRLGGAFIG